MVNILVADPEYFTQEAVEALKGVGNVTLKRMSRKELLENAQGFDVLVVRVDTKVDRKLLEKAKRLRLIVSATTGLNHIDVDYAKGKGIKVINFQGTHTLPTAEHTMALILGLCRKVPFAFENMKKGKWERHKFIGDSLDGKTLGIIGFGRIGQQVGQCAKAFGMKIIAFDPYVKSSDVEMVPLDVLLKKSDIVTIHAILTKETENMIGSKQFGMMKKGAMIINVARGGIIDNTTLLKALNDGKISGAALDVYANEPICGDDLRLIEYTKSDSNLLLTPHIAALTKEAIKEASLEIASQIKKHFS